MNEVIRATLQMKVKDGRGADFEREWAKIAEEVRKVEGFGPPDVELKDAEVKVAHQLIEALAADWDPEKYKDTFQENLKQLIEAKLEGGDVVEVEKPKKLAPVVDLMAALKQSLAQMEGKKKPAATIKSEEPAVATAKSRRK